MRMWDENIVQQITFQIFLAPADNIECEYFEEKKLFENWEFEILT